MKKIMILIVFFESIFLYGQDYSAWIDLSPEYYMSGIELLNNGKQVGFQGWMYHVGRLNRTELRIFRNMIYAKHGYIFNSIDLQQYFSQFSWYSGTKTNVDNELTTNERSVIDFIRQIESNFPSEVPEELIGLWRYDLPENWWTYRNPAYEFYDHHRTNLRFYSNGMFNYHYDIDYRKFYDYFGFWSLVENKLELKFYFVGIDYNYYVFDPDIHQEYWTINFEEEIFFFNRRIDEFNIELWECNFQQNLPSWKRIHSDPHYVRPG
jgi:hypothetical protein